MLLNDPKKSLSFAVLLLSVGLLLLSCGVAWQHVFAPLLHLSTTQSDFFHGFSIGLAENLGMKTMVLNINEDGWKIETEFGVVMDGDKAEHIKEAAGVIGRYVDIIGVRSFAGLKDRTYDYSEPVLNQFIKYSGVPVVSMEAATRHPLQSLRM